MAVEIRPATLADAPAIASVHVESWKTTYPGIVPADYLQHKLTVAARIVKWREVLAQPKPGTYDFVAVNAQGEIVGFVDGGPERSGDQDFKSELYAIYLLHAAQGQGLGKRLTHTLVERLVADGWRNLMVWVLEANPATRFYAHLGGQPVRYKMVKIGGVELPEVAYGWPDLRVLLERTRAKLP